MAMIESMGMGLPVIGSSHGSLKELVTKERGFTCDNFNDFLNNVNKPSNEFDRVKLKELTRKEFSTENMAKSYLKKYEEVISGRELNSKKPIWARKEEPETKLGFWNEIDKALEIQLKLIKEWEKIGKQDGYVYEELGEIYLLQKKNEARKKYFKMAYEKLSQDKWFAKNKSERLARLKTLSR